jgi:hypothetical protein
MRAIPISHSAQKIPAFTRQVSPAVQPGPALYTNLYVPSRYSFFR